MINKLHAETVGEKKRIGIDKKFVSVFIPVSFEKHLTTD